MRVRLQAIPIPVHRFSHVHMDLVGLLAPSGGFRYLFTFIDRATRWIEVIPLDKTATALIAGWVTRFGVPASLTSDRGLQFSGAIWRELCHALGIGHISTTAYHPEGNGMVERTHRRLKDALRACFSGLDWANHLPWVLLGAARGHWSISGSGSFRYFLSFAC